ncbi:MAG: hypothetical protein FJ349_04355 [Sphingomonadales bacterium]|nr:hypothetical protein [Sphingomonadales bacterium]
MTWTDLVYKIGDTFQWSFGFYEFVQNYFNIFLILLGFFGFYFWMRTQKKLSDQANVSIDIKENKGWYNKEGQQLK